MRIKGGAALAVVIGLVLAPIAVGNAAYGEESDETVVVAPDGEGTDDAVATAEVPTGEDVVPTTEDVAPPADEVVPPVEEAVPPVEDTGDAQPVAVLAEEKKVWVCKYTGTPGVDEAFKDGLNPIAVGEATLGADFTGTFPYAFADAQGRSVAIAYGDQDVTIDDCPDPEGPPEEPIAVAPSGSVYDECGTENDAVDVDEVEGIEYVIDDSVPNQVTVTAYALEGFTIVLPDDSEFTYDAEAGAATIVITFTDEPCPTGVTPGATPVDECGTENDVVDVTDDPGLWYEFDWADDGSVDVAAWANEGYTVVLPEGSAWIYDPDYDGAHLPLAFTDEPCAVVVPPAPAATPTAVLAATGGDNAGPLVSMTGGVMTLLGIALLIAGMIRRRAHA